MKKVWAVAKGWIRADHLNNRERIGDIATWWISAIGLYFLSRHFHFGGLATFAMVTMLPFLFSETYCFFAIRDRLKKERGEKEQA